MNMLDIRFRRDEATGLIHLGDFGFPKEFACKCGCGLCDIDWRVWYVCQLVRQRFNSPATIHCGCRCDQHNQNTPGAAKDSDHRFGWAADVAVPGTSSFKVADFLETLPDVLRIGLYEPGGLNGEDGFVHTGVRDRGAGAWKRWRFDAQRNLISSE